VGRRKGGKGEGVSKKSRKRCDQKWKGRGERVQWLETRGGRGQVPRPEGPFSRNSKRGRGNQSRGRGRLRKHGKKEKAAEKEGLKQAARKVKGEEGRHIRRDNGGRN